MSPAASRAVLLVGIVYSYLRGGAPGSPQRAARICLNAIRTYDCATAWRYFSSDSQKAIEIKSAQRKADPSITYVPREYLEPKNLYCWPTVSPVFSGYKANTVTLLKVEGDTAIVSVKKGIPTGFLIPGFWPTKTRYEDQELRLVRQDGKWKIAFQPPF